MDMKCKATNKDGQPCSATVYQDQFCRWHHPDLEAQRQAERAAGGRAKSSTARARKRLLAGTMGLTEVDASLCSALVDVLAGELEPGVGTAAAGIARAIASVRQVAEIEKRLETLETSAGHRERSTA